MIINPGFTLGLLQEILPRANNTHWRREGQEASPFVAKTEPEKWEFERMLDQALQADLPPRYQRRVG